MSIRNTDPDRERNIAFLLQEARGHRTYTEMAEMLGVTRSALSQWESGKRTPDTDQLIKISVHAAKGGEMWLRDLCLKCLNVRYPEMNFCLVKDGALVVA